MCRLRNIAMRDYQESVTIGQTDTRTHRQTPDKVIPMCRYASQATQNYRTDRHTHTQTDAGQSDPYVPQCFAGDTKTNTLFALTDRRRTKWSLCAAMLRRRHKNKHSFCTLFFICKKSVCFYCNLRMTNHNFFHCVNGNTQFILWIIINSFSPRTPFVTKCSHIYQIKRSRFRRCH